MNVVRVENPGRDYRLVIGQAPRPAPGSGQVLIAVAAAGLNNADLLQARGHYPPPPGASPILGMEVSGTIAELGSNVSGWQPWHPDFRRPGPYGFHHRRQ
jgi:NADPH:quinone reductase-like Zn-dependent oxidoreductase